MRRSNRCRIPDGIESNWELGVRESRFQDATAALNERGRHSANVFGADPSTRCSVPSVIVPKNAKALRASNTFFAMSEHTSSGSAASPPFATAHSLSGEPTPPYINKVLKTRKITRLEENFLENWQASCRVRRRYRKVRSYGDGRARSKPVWNCGQVPVTKKNEAPRGKSDNYQSVSTFHVDEACSAPGRSSAERHFV